MSRMISIVAFACTVVALPAHWASGQTCDVSWDGGASDDLWSSDLNWSTDERPGSTDDVCHDSGSDVVLYDVEDLEYAILSFTATGGSGRALTIDDALTLNVSLDLTNSSTTAAYTITLGGEGRINCDRDVSELAFVLEPQPPAPSNMTKLEVVGDISDCTFDMQGGTNVSAAGDIVDCTFDMETMVEMQNRVFAANIYGGTWTLIDEQSNQTRVETTSGNIEGGTWTLGGTTPSSAIIQVSSIANITGGTWTLNGTNASGNGPNIQCFNGTFSPTAVMIKSSPNTSEEVVAQTILGGIWKVGDVNVANTANTLVEATNGIDGGTWHVRKEARVATTGSGADIQNGIWTVELDAEVEAEQGDIIGGSHTLNQGKLTAEVAAPSTLVVDNGEVNVETMGRSTSATRLTIKDGGAVSASVAGIHTYANSVLGYQGSGGSYEVGGDLSVDEDFKRVGGGSPSLALTVEGSFNIGADISGSESDWDVRGVKLTMVNQSTDKTKEVISPDLGAVFFSDSTCVKYWGDFTISPGGGGAAKLVNNVNNETTMTGSAAEAMYVHGSVKIESGASLNLNSLTLYYTGTLDGTPSGGSATAAIITLYGDFDGDGEGDEAADLDRFEDAFGTGGTYDPLVDFDCDGDVDCTDWARYVSNWGVSEPPGVDCP